MDAHRSIHLLNLDGTPGALEFQLAQGLEQARVDLSTGQRK